MVNIGPLDRLMRFLLGAVLMASPFLPALNQAVVTLDLWSLALTAMGLAMMTTALVRFCPLYTALGIPTQRG